MQERPANPNPLYARTRRVDPKKALRKAIELREPIAERLPLLLPPLIDHLFFVLEGKNKLDPKYGDLAIGSALSDPEAARRLHRTIRNFNSRESRRPLEVLERILKRGSFCIDLIPILERVSEVRQEFGYAEDGERKTIDNSHFIQTNCLSCISNIMNSEKVGDLRMDVLRALDENTSREPAILREYKGSADVSRSDYMFHYSLCELDSIIGREHFSAEHSPFVFEIVVSRKDAYLLLELSLVNIMIGNDSLSSVSGDITKLRGFFYDISERMMKITSALRTDSEKVKVYIPVISPISDKIFSEERLRIFKFLLCRIEASGASNEDMVSMLYDMKGHILSPWMREPFHKSPLVALLKRPLSPQNHETIKVLDMIAVNDNFDRERMFDSVDMISKKEKDIEIYNSYKRFLALLEMHYFNPNSCYVANALFRKGNREDFEAIFSFLEMVAETNGLNRVLSDENVAKALGEIANGSLNARTALKSLGLCVSIMNSPAFAAEEAVGSFCRIPERTRGDNTYLALISFNSMLRDHNEDAGAWKAISFIVSNSEGLSLSTSMDIFSIMAAKEDVGVGRIGEAELRKIIGISDAAVHLDPRFAKAAPLALYRIFEQGSFGIDGLDAMLDRISRPDKGNLFGLLEIKANLPIEPE